MRSMRTLAASLILSGIALAIPAGPAEAQTNGFVLHCLSARAAGQACVTRARADVPTNLFHDPAAIAWFDRPALEANLSAFVPSLTFRNDANPRVNDGAVHAYPLASLAFIGPKPLDALSWGVGVEPIGGFGSDFVLRHQLLGPRQYYESFFAALKAGPVIAVQVAPGLSLGAGAYATYAQIQKFRMPFTMPPNAAAGMGMLMQMDEHYPGMFAAVDEMTAYGDSRDFDGWGLGATVGAAWRGSNGLRISASWSSKTTLSLDGATAVIDMNRQFEAMFGVLVQERMMHHGMSQADARASVAQVLAFAGMNPELGARATYRAETELSVPQSAGVGVSFQATPRWNIALEGVWRDWSDAESVMPFILTEGDNPNVNILVNGDPANGDFTYPFPLHWEDSWTGKAGVEFRPGATTALRAGYLYGSNPVPENTVFVAFPAIATHAVTAGVGFDAFGVPLEVSLVHAPSTEIVGTAAGHRLGNEYRGSVTTMRQTVLTFGAVWSF